MTTAENSQRSNDVLLKSRVKGGVKSLRGLEACNLVINTGKFLYDMRSPGRLWGIIVMTVFPYCTLQDW